VKAWSEVLQRVPGSQMLIEGKDLGRAQATQRLREQFEKYGVGAERLKFVQRDSSRQYLTYHDIDVALDAFPLTGGTTTFDALWMGVPVVSLEGRTFRERLSTTIIVNGGFGQDLCKSVPAYVERAVELASDVPALKERRARQRDMMKGSVLMDEARYVKLFGQALRMVWSKWCEQQEPNGVSADKPVQPGQDVLVAVNGKRITLPSALAWLQRLNRRIAEQPQECDITSARALACAILQVAPETGGSAFDVLHNPDVATTDHSIPT